MLRGLDHIQLAMPLGEEATARAFYGVLLGLTEIAKPEPLLLRGGCWFAGPGIQLHLGVETPFDPARKAHPGFLVENLDMLYAQLDAAGVTLTLDDSLPEVRRFYAADPFGNRLEFLQDGEGFSQRP